MRLRSGQYKDHVFRRLFQRLQQSVEGSCGKHVDLVDDIYFFPSCRRRIFHALPQFPDIVHSIVGRCIDLDHIKERSLFDLSAYAAVTAGTISF